MSLFNRPKADATTPWKEDPALVKNQKRLAELDALLDAHHGRLRELNNAVDAAEGEVRRAEIEILAERGSEANLSTKQAALIAAQRARAIAVLAQEDAAAEKAKLDEALPKLERAAKIKAKAAVQARYLAAARELRAALEAVVVADARVTAIHQEALAMFPTGDHVDTLPDGRRDPDLPAAAGCGDVGRTVFYRQVGLLRYEKPGGHAQDWLRQVEAAIETAERASGK